MRKAKKSALLFISILAFSLLPPIEARRGGGGAGRSGGGGFGRGSSAGRSSSGGGGGGFGSRGATNRGGSVPTGGNAYHRNMNIGGTNPKQPSSGSGGGFGNTHSSGGYRGSGGMGGVPQSNTGKSKGILGGLFGGRKQAHSGYGRSGGIFSGGPRYTKTGVGSMSRGNTFKNMIVGAAAGYLAYSAGRAIIRAATSPMMWNNRPYYWGANHYQPGPGRTNMCRMPIDSSDPQFGNIYFQDQSRPREITWGCGYYEHCCGYECCRGGGGDSIGGRGSSIGYALVVAFIARAYLF